ncbi:MAG: ABC transporter permease, partial [Gemmatimonadota bacterium]
MVARRSEWWGNVVQLRRRLRIARGRKEESRETRGGSWIEEFRRNLRYAIRTLVRTPGYTTVVILTLALGIGANAAIFTVVNAVLLRPLGYADPDRLVFLQRENTTTVSPATFLDWKEQTRSFERMAVAEYWTPSLAGTGTPVEVTGLHVSADMFTMLGVQPAMGRTFRDDEGHAGSDHVVVVGQAFWKTRLGGDPRILNRAIMLDGEPYTVIGIMPPDFVFAPFWATSATLWVPMVLDGRRTDRETSSLRPFARLAAGVSLEAARADVADVNARIEARLGEPPRRVTAIPLREKVVGDIRDKLFILLAAVAFVLLIACANVAHLQLMRAAARECEFGVRMALGATRRRLSQQSLEESLVLALAGAALGLLLAFLGVRALVAIGPPDIPRLASVSIDWKVVAYLVSAALVSAFAFGVAPAVAASRTSVGRLMQDGGRGGSEGRDRRRLRGALVISEFAIALVLLVGAGLVVKSFAALTSVDPGFDPTNIASMVVTAKGSSRSEPASRAAFYRELVSRIAALPGVASASAINHLPLHGDNWTFSFAAEGESYPDASSRPRALFRIVHPAYFATMRIPIIRGRDYRNADRTNGSRMVIVNARLAERRWPQLDPVGRRISVAGVGDPDEWFTVVGVAGNAKQGAWTAEETEEMFFLSAEHAARDAGPASRAITLNPERMTLVVRTNDATTGIIVPAQREITRLAPGATVSDIITVEQAIGEQTATPRFYALLMSTFGLIALLLAAVGVYGVISYSVSRRSREMGIRLALGAGSGGAFWLILREGLSLAAVGLAIGLVVALALVRFLRALLFGVAPTDLATFLMVILALAIVALVACALPARRASRVN